MKVGDKVKISKTSRYYKQGTSGDYYNPPDVVGVVTSLSGSGWTEGLPIDVKWPDVELVNDYAESDLEVVE